MFFLSFLDLNSMIINSWVGYSNDKPGSGSIPGLRRVSRLSPCCLEVS
jgi:hypothetical protein